jgi:hypothetical protein
VIARLAMALLLVAMAVGQLASVGAFADALRDYRLLGDAAQAFAYAVPVTELGAALALLLGRAAGGILGLAVAGFWTVLASQAFARGLHLENCGCFGRYLAQELRWWVLIEDAEFLLLAGWAAWRTGLRAGVPAFKRFVLGGALMLVVAGCAGGDDRTEAERSEAELIRSIEKEVATLDLGPGLGEGSSPNPLAGWKTDFEKHAVPLSEFESGGPRKDGIPPIDDPRFLPVGDVDFVRPREPVIELVVGDDARAYPIQILIWHEIVNDTVGGLPVAVTFCPLCNTAIVFDRRIDGRILDFGTTGNLRNADLVMYDRQTESWWQQFGGRALVGTLTGEKLEQVPARIVAWSEFRRAHPDGTVLSRETGHERSYGQNPYFGYDDVDTPPFFSTRNSRDDRLLPKERVVFIERADEAVAVPFSVLRRRKTVTVEVGGHRLVVRWRGGVASSLDRGEVASGRDVGTAEVREDGRLVPFHEPFWFTVAAFRPNARLVR